MNNSRTAYNSEDTFTPAESPVAVFALPVEPLQPVFMKDYVIAPSLSASEIRVRKKMDLIR